MNVAIEDLSTEHLELVVGMYPSGFNLLQHRPQPVRCSGNLVLNNAHVKELIEWQYLRPTRDELVCLTDDAYEQFEMIVQTYRRRL